MVEHALPFLSDAEIAGICDGLVAPAAQIRHLKRMGLLVNRKPNGKPLLMRSELERVLGAARFSQPAAATAHNAATTPNRARLMEVNAESRRGTQAQRR